MNRPARAFTLLAGVLLLASGIAHATLGWRQFAPVLTASSVPADIIGALAAGWYFGSVAMLAFGAIALAAALVRSPSPALHVGIIGGAYIAFGLGAYVLRHFNPHFLGFVVIGLIAAIGAWLSRTG